MNKKFNRDTFDDKKIKIPFFVPTITDKDIEIINQVLKNPLLTDGPILKKFEKEFARFTGSKYAFGVSNGTAALHLALKSLDIKKGDEVIIPDITFVATASAVSLTGATPVFADISKYDLNILPESILNNITKKTKAIIPVHMAGKACQMNQIQKISKENNLILIEDCAHAIGTKFNNKHVGIFGKAGCFSFYPTKNMTTIEGGMIITNSKKIAEKIRILRNHGINRTLRQRYSQGKPWEYDVSVPGYNYRLDEIRSALGINQLKNLKERNLLRKNAVKYYNKNLIGIKGIELFYPIKNSIDSHHLYIIKISDEYPYSRDDLFKKLLKKGVRTSVHYKPIHKFSAFKNLGRTYTKLENSITEYKKIISLPLYPEISKNEINYITKCIKELSKE